MFVRIKCSAKSLKFQLTMSYADIADGSVDVNKGRFNRCRKKVGIVGAVPLRQGDETIYTLKED